VAGRRSSWRETLGASLKETIEPPIQETEERTDGPVHLSVDAGGTFFRIESGPSMLGGPFHFCPRYGAITKFFVASTLRMFRKGSFSR
jgi:hypothetical protein